MVSLPAVLVASPPTGQTFVDAEADALGAVFSSAGAHAARAAINRAAPPAVMKVFRLTMSGSLGHVSPAGAVRRHPVMTCHNGVREDVRRVVRRASGEGGGAVPGVVHRRRAGPRSPLHREEGRRGGGRVLDGRRARGPGTGRGGDLPVALPGPGPDDRDRPRPQGRVPTSLTCHSALTCRV